MSGSAVSVTDVTARRLSHVRSQFEREWHDRSGSQVRLGIATADIDATDAA